MRIKTASLLSALLLAGAISVPLAAAKAAAGSPTAKAAKPAKPAKAGAVVVDVYYFHGNARCYSCNLIESQAKEAVERDFAGDLKKGGVRFQSINVQTPGNEHYLQDFNIGAKSVVVVRSEGGKQKSFRALDKVWVLLRDKPAFLDYIVQNVKALKKAQ